MGNITRTHILFKIPQQNLQIKIIFHIERAAFVLFNSINSQQCLYSYKLLLIVTSTGIFFFKKSIFIRNNKNGSNSNSSKYLYYGRTQRAPFCWELYELRREFLPQMAYGLQIEKENHIILDSLWNITTHRQIWLLDFSVLERKK